MPSTRIPINRDRLRAGLPVYSDAGRLVGPIERIDADSITAAGQPYPLDAIERFEGDRVVLTRQVGATTDRGRAAATTGTARDPLLAAEGQVRVPGREERPARRGADEIRETAAQEQQPVPVALEREAVPVERRDVAARVRPLPAAVCALAGATALIHLWLGATTSVLLATQPELVASLGGATALTVMAALFYANGVGYVALTGALYHPHPMLRRYRRVTRWRLIGFTALTVLAYFALAQGHIDAFGLADKAIEGLLIALLVVEDRRAR